MFRPSFVDDECKRCDCTSVMGKSPPCCRDIVRVFRGRDLKHT